MFFQIVDLKCPSCATPWGPEMKTCPACGRPVVISSFNSVYGMPNNIANGFAIKFANELKKDPENSGFHKSLAFCYLKLKMYDKALPAFERAIENNFDDSELFFYAAICYLRGKKAFVAQRADINKAIEYIDAANMIEPKGIYYYLLAYIKYDFFERKSLNSSPNYQECLSMANSYGVSEYDVNNLFAILGVPKPGF